MLNQVNHLINLINATNFPKQYVIINPNLSKLYQLHFIIYLLCNLMEF
jgi:hypothetical protein